jgi:hypothetical protein
MKKLIVAQLMKFAPDFYGVWRFVVMLTTAQASGFA